MLLHWISARYGYISNSNIVGDRKSDLEGTKMGTCPVVATLVNFHRNRKFGVDSILTEQHTI